MTAEAHGVGLGTPGRTPAEVRAALGAADRVEFERRHRAALDRAGTDYDLTPVHEVLDEWWQVAVLGADPAAHRRMLDRAADLRAGTCPRGTSWDAVRTQLGL